MRFACGTRGQGPVPFPTHTSPALVEHSCSWSNITAAAVDDSSLQLDGRGSGELCTGESPTPCVAERACMHVSSLSSTVLMLGRSSGRCAQHSAVSVWILSLVEGIEICGRIPRKALKAASTPVIPSKARRS